MSESLRQIAVLFARQDSIYKTLPGCDVWDIERDARKWPGGCPVVAHPPCRAWGRLRLYGQRRTFPTLDQVAMNSAGGRFRFRSSGSVIAPTNRPGCTSSASSRRNCRTSRWCSAMRPARSACSPAGIAPGAGRKSASGSTKRRRRPSPIGFAAWHAAASCALKGWRHELLRTPHRRLCRGDPAFSPS